MNKTVAVLATAVVLAAVFAVASPVDVAVAQTSDAMPDDEEQYKDGGHEGKSCPNKERKAQESSL